MLLRIVTCALLIIATCTCATGNDTRFEGTISATVTRAGSEAAHFVFTRKRNLLRAENTANRLEPINIVDLDAKRLTIVYPHNTTFVKVDLEEASANSGNASRHNQWLAGIPSPPAMPPTPNKGHIGPNVSGLPSHPSGFRSPAPMPSMPGMPLPNQAGSTAAAPGIPPIPSLPPGVGPGPGTGHVSGMPAMPAGIGPGMGGGIGMPPMLGMPAASELKKEDETKKIQGFDCTLYSISGRGEKMEVWATNDSSAFPFRLITRDYIGRHFGPQTLEETWPEMLRAKSLFPLEATLKMDPGGQERFSFKVDGIENKKLEDPTLFQPPNNYIEIQAPQL
jgi:hypothetical protein